MSNQLIFIDFIHKIFAGSKEEKKKEVLKESILVKFSMGGDYFQLTRKIKKGKGKRNTSFKK